MGPLADGVALREFLLRVPPDAPAGITVRWVWLAGADTVGEPQSLAVPAAEFGKTASLETALMKWLSGQLEARGLSPAGSSPRSLPVPPAPAVPSEAPIGRLG